MSGDDEGRRTGRRRSVLRAVGLTLAGALVAGCAAAGWAYWHLNSNIKSVDINSALGDDRPARATPSPSASAAAPLPTEAVNILVLGSDSRSGEENQALGGGSSTGARSDTAMVVHIDAGRTAATVVSIPRDTLVTRPSCPLESGGSTAVSYGAMFNSAYAVGGPVCAVKTVESITDVRMDHYVEIDFSGFAKLVDALGGVTVTTDEDIDDDDSHLHLKAGTHHLDGKRALALARTRHGIGDGSDLGRIGLQQQLVKALLERISSAGLLTDPAKLYSVADALTGSLTTDTGLDSLTELMSLGESLKGLSSDAVRTVTMPVVTAPSDPNRVVAKEPAASELWESLR
ncbi:LCP family protein required for cell wall assembly [Streptomyces sp. SAI-208]|uniref:LCP family protein n=1 Tax=unclassified Streptomyces TaxID=2593676 RepID=UPI0024737F80|nr:MULTISPECIES: LCP family protein [unclassified Streptomyces]MDH6517077.1 LCP family protein required for cell wall assembly [Streptomyces sp. SAI-090]MDH6549292.1 LCP family protein required for cell wall assembly [Streptomyces sp. SAI-041]MDH6568357.1 LCP family protein required for cell wall assembly [Streptomyces sp. SAI-117]MDH6607897.1 LCP family protein required for cell wall assembly [Streptomyces sp. SAI-208]